jgi:regulator of replication initiation timing
MTINEEEMSAEMESKLSQKADRYEISSLNSDVGNLQHSIREISAENSRLRLELQDVQDKLNQIQQYMEAHP